MPRWALAQAREPELGQLSVWAALGAVTRALMPPDSQEQFFRLLAVSARGLLAGQVPPVVEAAPLWALLAVAPAAARPANHWPPGGVPATGT